MPLARAHALLMTAAHIGMVLLKASCKAAKFSLEVHQEYMAAVAGNVCIQRSCHAGAGNVYVWFEHAMLASFAFVNGRSTLPMNIPDHHKTYVMQA